MISFFVEYYFSSQFDFMKSLFSAFAVLIVLNINAQDTLTVMQYNLLNYNNYTTYCTTDNNLVADKDGYIKTIIDYVLPDIFTVVEINETTTSLDRLLNNVMNTSGRTNYARANRSNYNGSDIVNMLYYNTDKLVFDHQIDLTNAALTRDINMYYLYYKDPNLATTHDTSWVTCIVMHLKAGSYASDATTRAAEVSVLMNYMNSINKAGNYLVMGDFNVYTSDEECFQNLINHPNANIRFYDPINQPGDWNNNGTYAPYHTQSTHTADNGCAATGGLDDRFDFILSSLDIITGGKKVKYLSGSYHALANDGNHFNLAINSGSNTSVPSNVLDAIYNNSDHLPIIMQLIVNYPTGIDDNALVPFDFYIPSENGQNNAVLTSHCNGQFKIEAFLTTGACLQVSDYQLTQGYNNISLTDFPTTGALIYFRITSPDGYMKVYRVVR
ncbi:MAG: hypothetical protein CVU11_16660 [Bacteroidetes bacterium HGW-Bacteroidetes-6]|nr:MAG: hypothetical protein CVU11_16660 [Bacteroidetes bacterium HGW-Bacteroidetes-6]